MMTDSPSRPAQETCAIDMPQWAPPHAPLDMPEQVLEPREGSLRFDILRLLRLLMPGNPV